MRTSRVLGAAALAAASFLLVPPALVSAHPTPAPPPTPTVAADGLGAPFNLALRANRVYFADGGLNLVGRLSGGGGYTTLAADQPGASGIALSRNGTTMAFTTTVTNFDTFENSASGLHVWGPKGERLYADTHAYEQAHNPDQVNTYGVANPSACVAGELAKFQPTPSYTGGPDSHAYSVAAWGNGWVVADAGANALFAVSSSGRIRTLAVLPPQPAPITAAFADKYGLDHCVVGVVYAFEPVPTDVEVGRDGSLYVTTLPGGDEGPELGARGAVWRVDPRSGRAHRVAGGLLGATNLALGRHGEIYVSELFGGQISVIRRGRATPYLPLPGVVAVETSASGQLWAATLGSEAGPGTIVRISQGRAHRQAVIRP